VAHVRHGLDLKNMKFANFSTLGRNFFQLTAVGTCSLGSNKQALKLKTENSSSILAIEIFFSVNEIEKQFLLLMFKGLRL
jgi:hypothetical protein